MTQIPLKLLEYPLNANNPNLPKLLIYPWTSKIIPKISKISKIPMKPLK